MLLPYPLSNWIAIALEVPVRVFWWRVLDAWERCPREVVRAAALVLLFGFLLAVITFASMIGGVLWLLYGPGSG